MKLELGKWIFWAISADYSQNIVKFHLSTESLNLDKDPDVNFADFFVR